MEELSLSVDSPAVRSWTASLHLPRVHQALRGQDRGPAPPVVWSGEWVAGSDLGVVDDPPKHRAALIKCDIAKATLLQAPVCLTTAVGLGTSKGLRTARTGADVP